ncbi:MAG: glycosyl hydrolase family 8 [Gemmatimonadota bacterium]
MTACSGATAAGGSPATRGRASGFLDAFARPDGRVTRPDQGGDTVSEGQAYGLLLAEVAGKPAEFGRIWQWTRTHLQLPSGLFAYHASAAGRQLSQQAASDADLLMAWALLRYHGPDAAARHRDGRRVAAAVLAHEVTTGPGGVPVLAAGPWATGRPASLDPSYWALPALTGLARLTGDSRWQRLAAGAVALAGRLTGGGRALPPDWAKLTAAGGLAPEPAPDGSQPQTQYGLDAQRTVAWFAASCDPRARGLAARWWALLRPAGRSQAQALHPDGAVLDPAPAPLPLVAAAAAARAAGQPRVSQRLLRQAGHDQRSHPTYYGGAWAALGPALLTGPLGQAC